MQGRGGQRAGEILILGDAVDDVALGAQDQHVGQMTALAQIVQPGLQTLVGHVVEAVAVGLFQLVAIAGAVGILLDIAPAQALGDVAVAGLDPPAVVERDHRVAQRSGVGGQRQITHQSIQQGIDGISAGLCQRRQSFLRRHGQAVGGGDIGEAAQAQGGDGAGHHQRRRNGVAQQKTLAHFASQKPHVECRQIV